MTIITDLTQEQRHSLEERSSQVTVTYNNHLLPLGASTAARAAPVLSDTNFGLSYARASRSNGWLEIDAAGFERNIAELRKLLDPQTRICVSTCAVH